MGKVSEIFYNEKTDREYANYSHRASKANQHSGYQIPDEYYLSSIEDSEEFEQGQLERLRTPARKESKQKVI